MANPSNDLNSESRYTQVQEFEIARTGNLVLVDWYTSGR
jgi:urease accessory protein UreH